MKKNIFIGLILIAIASLIILSELNYIVVGNFWWIFINVVLGAIALSSLIRLHFVLAFVSGGIVLNNILIINHLNHLGIWMLLLVTILLGIGFNIIFKNIKRDKWIKHTFYYKKNLSDFHKHKNEYQYNNHNNIKYTNNFGSTTKFIKANNLEYILLENNLGSLIVYFDGSTLSSQGTKIDVNCELGNIKIYIPKEYYVVCHIEAVLGSVSLPIQVLKNKDISNTITLSGRVSLGTVDIIRS
ncbi:MAG: hypothetical protein LBT75_01110 [Bacilli bacterium]|jgi:predicted membrane protein|nr:hypothetical protein [Bacilli bacterium]